MKNKYVSINGLAFSENKDMEKLSSYAKDGWLLEGIVGGGFFYKLRKGEPRDIIYNLDYQMDTNPEYLSIMKEAGWEHVISVGDQIHIFSAKPGTKPIYSDKETEQDKYITVRNQTKKGSIYTLIIGVVLCMLTIISNKIYEPLFFLMLGLLIVDVVVFVFNFMPYVAYNYRVSQTNNGNKQDENIIMKSINKLMIFLGAVPIVFGVLAIVKNKSVTVVTVFLIIFGSFTIISTLISQKKDKKLNN
jgi:hypothetical protein